MEITEKLKEKKAVIKELEERIVKLREENLEYRFTTVRSEQESKHSKDGEALLVM